MNQTCSGGEVGALRGKKHSTERRLSVFGEPAINSTNIY